MEGIDLPTVAQLLGHSEVHELSRILQILLLTFSKFIIQK